MHVVHAIPGIRMRQLLRVKDTAGGGAFKPRPFSLMELFDGGATVHDMFVFDVICFMMVFVRFLTHGIVCWDHLSLAYHQF